MPSKNPARSKRRNKQREEKNRAARKAAAAAEALPQVARVAQPPLERYFSRKQIRRHQFDAGTKLYEYWVGSGGPGSVVGSYGQTVHSHDAGSPYQLRCYERFRSGLQAVGILLSPVLVAVCIYDQSAREWARLYGRSEEDGIGILRLALDGLAAHYGFHPDPGEEKNSVAQHASAVIANPVMLEKVTADAP